MLLILIAHEVPAIPMPFDVRTADSKYTLSNYLEDSCWLSIYVKYVLQTNRTESSAMWSQLYLTASTPNLGG